MTDINTFIRSGQVEDEHLGHLYQTLYILAERMAKKFFADTPSLPRPIITLEPDGTRRGYFEDRDSLGCKNRINLNMYVIDNGMVMAEVLMHEMVHLWLHHIGQPTVNDHHGNLFNDKLTSCGILSKGVHGRHEELLPHWRAWMAAQADLQMHRFALPSTEHEPPRRTLKHECPGCGASFHCRVERRVRCLDCEADYRIV